MKKTVDDAQDLINYDPLSEVTRKERRSLLGIAMLGLALITIPLVPQKLSALGLEFSDINQKTFVNLYALLLTYYIVAFLVYAFADYIAWRRGDILRYSAHVRSSPDDKLGTREPVEQTTGSIWGSRNPVFRGMASWLAGMVASRLRAFFDLVFPLAFAGYVLRGLLTFVP